MFFPTVSTHTPFTPTPPYQPDWGRMFDEQPYDPADLDRSFEDVADWLDLGPGYVKAVDYALRTVAGYLRLRADRDLVMIVIGDHQPPAPCRGEGAPWDVPVHVIASRPELLAQPARARLRGWPHAQTADPRSDARAPPCPPQRVWRTGMILSFDVRAFDVRRTPNDERTRANVERQ